MQPNHSDLRLERRGTRQRRSINAESSVFGGARRLCDHCYTVNPGCTFARLVAAGTPKHRAASLLASPPLLPLLVAVASSSLPLLVLSGTERQREARQQRRASLFQPRLDANHKEADAAEAGSPFSP